MASQLADLDRVALGQRMIERRQAMGICRRPPDLRPGRRAKGRDAVDMVAMVVGDQDIRKRPVPRGESRGDRCGLGRCRSARCARWRDHAAV